MPYKSDAQRRFFNANRDQLEADGVDVDHWNETSKGKKLPEKVKKSSDTSRSLGIYTQAERSISELAKSAADISLINVLDDDDNMLLIRRSEDNTRSGVWESPLGHKDPGETDLQAAHRELGEETGLKARLLPKTTTVRTPDGKKQLRLYVGRVKGVKPDVSTDPEEHDKHRWVSPAQLSKVPKTNSNFVSDTEKLFKLNDLKVKVASTQGSEMLTTIEKLAKAAANSEDLVDMDSTGGLLADYLSPTAWGGERAGRSQSMATAIDEPSTFGVRHPYTQTAGYATGGGLLGGLAGAGIAALPGLFGKNYTKDHLGIGAGVGAGLGGLAGIGLAGHNRRKAMKNTNEKYDMANEAGEVKPKNPDFSWLSALLAPMRGPHRTGQLESVRAMKGNGTIGDQRSRLRDVLYSAHHWPTPAGAMAGGVVSGAHGLAQNLKTQLQDADTDKSKRKKSKPGSVEAYRAKLDAKKKDKEDEEDSDVATVAKAAAAYTKARQ